MATHPLHVRLTIALILLIAQASIADEIDFNRDIRPILSDRCLACHGPDANHREGGFRLDQRESAVGVADSGERPIVAGDPDSSELMRRITTSDESSIMPPLDSGKTLSNDEISLLRQWIKSGATWQEHWAYVPPTKQTPPESTNPKWIRNEIDHFVLDKLEAAGLQPSQEASRETLIRRLSFDLIGLPPSLSEIDEFVNDTSDNAYEKLVDRLLQSPHYGERMAVTWLDGARYADTNGYQNDFYRIMWPWRDWVIDSFNSNKPYDQFIIEQIAGDLLPNASQSQRIATGFCRNNRTVTEAGSIAEEWHVENVIDRVETASVVFLGLTMGCARCHDHKYDPITQKEFYEFYAFFNSTADEGFYSEKRGNAGPQVETARPELTEFDARISEARLRLKNMEENQSSKDFILWLESLQDPPKNDFAIASVLEMPLNGSLEVRAEGKDAAFHARMSTEPSKWTPGLLWNALELPGDSNTYVELRDLDDFDRDSSFSISLWIRPEARLGALWSKMDDGAAFRGLDALMHEDGRISVHLIHQWDGNAIKVTTNQALRLREWNHVCVTYDGSSQANGLKIFFDGKAIPATIDVDRLTGSIKTGQQFRLGSRSNSAFVRGHLRQLQIFDRPLQESDVREIIDATLASNLDAQEEIPTNTRKALRHIFNARDNEIGLGREELASLISQKKEYLKETPISTVMVLEELPTPRPTYLLKRGQYDAPDRSSPLSPSVPAFLPPLPEDVVPNRLALAHWIADPANPLTSRVAVNRIWQQLFGSGIVRTSDNFGFQGAPPTHPELLDWLATEFVHSDWDVKAIQKKIVMSATYRQSSNLSPELALRDPENRLLSRAPRYRLQAEFIRNNALAVSGLLSRKIGGASVKPYQPDGLWQELAGGANDGPYVQGSGDDLYRRSLYTYRKRSVPHATTSTFDAPSWEICVVDRARTNTPLQALALLNDTTYVEAARVLATRMIREGGDDVTGQLRFGFRAATGRIPTQKELLQLVSAHDRYIRLFQDDLPAAKAFIRVGASKPSSLIDDVTLAAMAMSASTILNLDETICKE
ncbi:DUF1553 domain-containing protein [Bremerella sp. P1]|uniref:DUF1553 domain-containing protein n=1 Tax=Bremerella sp. P1 TaxID=3026424 RepID=UPI00236847D5|nr:DUF1553 domain-containing protein [Bremerella sp. P1]WDI41060.1 DUF1553 domain-containing protein [Bremerella sp. P1]